MQMVATPSRDGGRGLDQLIEPLTPNVTSAESAAQEAFDEALLSKLTERRNQLELIRKNRKKELAKIRRSRPFPTKSITFDPSQYVTMEQLKEVYEGSSSRYIITEVKVKVPDAKYLTKKKWFLGIRIIPLTDRDRQENEQLLREREESSSGREHFTSESGSDESEYEDEVTDRGDIIVRETGSGRIMLHVGEDVKCDGLTKREIEDDPVPTKKSSRKRPLPCKVEDDGDQIELANINIPVLESPSPSRKSPEDKLKRSKKSKIRTRFMFPMGPMSHLAAKGKLREPPRRTGLAGQIEMDLASAGLTTDMGTLGTRQRITNVVSTNGQPHFVKSDLDLSVLAKKDTASRTPLPIESAEQFLHQQLKSTMSPSRPCIKENGTENNSHITTPDDSNLSTNHKVEALGANEPPQDKAQFKKKDKVKKSIGNKKSSKVIDGAAKSTEPTKPNKMKSKKSVGAAILRAVKTKAPKKPRKKKNLEIEAWSSDEQPMEAIAKKELVYQMGAKLPLSAVRDYFYPGRNTQMITKSMQLRIPGSFYNRTKKFFHNVTIMDAPAEC